jgi:hypothetical protein
LLYETSTKDFNDKKVIHSYTRLRIVNFIFFDETHNEIQIVSCDQHVGRYCLVVIVVWHLDNFRIEFKLFYLKQHCRFVIFPQAALKIKIIVLRHSIKKFFNRFDIKELNFGFSQESGWSDWKLMSVWEVKINKTTTFYVLLTVV